MFVCETFEEYLSIQIDILYILKIKNNKLRLRPKPKKFFIHCVKLYLEGVDITSIDASERLRDHMGWDTSDDVYTYRTNLKKQGWLVPDTSTVGNYNILPVFRLNDSSKVLKNYNFQLKCIETSLKEK